MRSIRKNAVAAVSLAVAATLSLAGCGGSSDANGSSSGAKKYVDGATFTMAFSSDPGALDPHSGVGQALFQANTFAYDSLVSMDEKGEIQSQLAKSWKVDGTTVTFDLNDAITCSDGAPFTAQTAADNITYVENPKNKSPYLGVFVPAGAKAAATGSTVTVTLASPSPFVLASFANLPMVCDAGLKDRSTLKSKTDGTGPYVLSEAAPGDHYTYDLRKGYTWGPNGATTAEKGLPATITVKVIENQTTTANELIAGTLNYAAVLGPDVARLSAMKLFHIDNQAMIGEQWLNHAKDHATSDPAVRKALTQAVDLDGLMKALTSGTGKTPTQLTLLAPTPCTYDAVGGNLPAFDAAAAGATLEAAGYAKGADGYYAKDGKTLKVNLLVDSAMGTGAGAAGELAVKAWKEAGIDASFQQKGTAALQGVLFGSGDWDLAWEPVNVSSPDQLVPFLSGPGVADGGTNFSGIDNADYSGNVTKAMAMIGAEGCDTWKAAEAALFQQADIVPFAANVLPSFGKGAEFRFVGSLVPTSIRMVG